MEFVQASISAGEIISFLNAFFGMGALEIHKIEGSVEVSLSKVFMPATMHELFCRKEWHSFLKISSHHRLNFNSPFLHVFIHNRGDYSISRLNTDWNRSNNSEVCVEPALELS